MTMETKQKKSIWIVVIMLFMGYFFILVPYVVHKNLTEVGAGVVIDSKLLPLQALPEDIQDVAPFNEECTVLLVQDSVSGAKRVIILDGPSHSVYKDDVIEITDKIIEWYVDWHAYQFFDEKFDVLIVGHVEQVEPLEASIEDLLHPRPESSIHLGGLIFSLSQIAFFSAPLILIVYTSRALKKRFYFWNITAILTLYSLEVFVFNVVGDMHHVTTSDTWKYFGYLFVVLIPFTFFFSKYEQSEDGQRGIKVFREKTAELIDRLFQ